MRQAHSRSVLVLAAVTTVGMGGFLTTRWTAPPADEARTRPVSDLADQLNESSPQLRREAAAALADLGPAAAAAVAPLVDTLRDPDPLTRAHAAVALGRIGTGALYRLGECLADPDERVRRGAVQALGILGPAAEPAIPRLAAALRDEDEPI